MHAQHPYPACPRLATHVRMFLALSDMRVSFASHSAGRLVEPATDASTYLIALRRAARTLVVEELLDLGPRCLGLGVAPLGTRLRPEGRGL